MMKEIQLTGKFKYTSPRYILSVSYYHSKKTYDIELTFTDYYTDYACMTWMVELTNDDVDKGISKVDYSKDYRKFIFTYPNINVN